MFALLATAALTIASPAPGPEPARVLVTLNGGGDYQPGDQVKVEIEPDEDGYLVVFRVDGDGYLRVVFPLDPDLDQFVRGGGRYELRGRGERASFLADDRGGTGLVFAALSREPLAFDRYAVGTHWDYERLRLDDPAGDVEAQLLGVVREMTDNGRFDYDAVGYRVWGPGYEAEPTVVVAGGYSDPYYDPAFACLACGWGTSSLNISIGNRYGYGYRDAWYDPWRDDYYGGWNRPYRYSSGWNGWWGWDSWYGTPYRPYTVINVPPRPVVVDSRTGLRSRPRQPIAGGLTSQPRLGTIPGGAGRSSDEVRPRTPTTTRDRARSGGTASRPAPATTRPSSSGTASPSRPAPTKAGTGTERTRSRGRPDDLSAVAPSTTGVDRRPQPAIERPVYRPPTSTSLPITRQTQAAPKSSARPSSSPPPRADDGRSRSSRGRSSTVSLPRTSSVPSSRSQPRTATPPRSTPSRSASPPRSVPSRSASPSRSVPSRSASPSRSSSPPQASRAPSRPVTRSAPATSSGKSSAPSRARGKPDA